MSDYFPSTPETSKTTADTPTPLHSRETTSVGRSTSELSPSISSPSGQPPSKRTRVRSPSPSTEATQASPSAERETEQKEVSLRPESAPRNEDREEESDYTEDDSDSEVEELDDAVENGWECERQELPPSSSTARTSSTSPKLPIPPLPSPPPLPKTSPFTTPAAPRLPLQPEYDREARDRSLYRGNPSTHFCQHPDPKVRALRHFHLETALQQALKQGLDIDETRYYILKYLEDLPQVGVTLNITEEELAEFRLSSEGAKARFQLKRRQPERAEEIRKPEADLGLFEKDPIPVEVPDPKDLYDRPPRTTFSSFVTSFPASELFQYDFEFSGVLSTLRPYIDKAKAQIAQGQKPEPQNLPPYIIAQCVKYSAIEFLDKSFISREGWGDNSYTSLLIHASLDTFVSMGLSEPFASDLANYCAGHDLIDEERIRINAEPKKKVRPTEAALDAQFFMQRVLFETLASSFGIYLTAVFLTGAATQYAYGSSNFLGFLSTEMSTTLNPFNYPEERSIRVYNTRHAAFTARAGAKRFGYVIMEYSTVFAQYSEDVAGGIVPLPTSPPPSTPSAAFVGNSTSRFNSSDPFDKVETIFDSLATKYGRSPETSKCLTFKELLESLDGASSLDELYSKVRKAIKSGDDESTSKNKRRRLMKVGRIMSLNPNFTAAAKASPILAFPFTFSSVAERFSSNSEEIYSRFISPPEVLKVLKHLGKELDDETRQRLIKDYGSGNKYNLVTDGLAKDRARLLESRKNTLARPVTVRGATQEIQESSTSPLPTSTSTSAPLPPRASEVEGTRFGRKKPKRR